MFIPTCVLVVAVVVLFLLFGRPLTGFLLILAIPVVLGSMAFGMYFWRNHEYATALVVGAPFLLLSLWVLIHSASKVWDDAGRLQPGTLLSFLRLHQAWVRLCHNPEAVMKARIGFAQQIHLGLTMYKLYDGIKYFPSWYKSRVPSPRDSRWSSVVIPEAAIATVSAERLKEYGIEEEYVGDDALVYKFSAQGRSYAFCVHSDLTPYWLDDDEPDEMGRWQLFHAYRAHVVELPTNKVLEIQLVSSSNAYTENYREDNIELFRPGPWLMALYEVADGVYAESEATSKALRSVSRPNARRSSRDIAGSSPSRPQACASSSAQWTPITRPPP
ncbi:MAG TPA: hypothetical protein VGK89_01185 [Candidatus Eisenbacteria bacterium]|jgi:hypothetical protein